MNHTNQVCRHHVPHCIHTVAQIYVFKNNFEEIFKIPLKWCLEETDIHYCSSVYGTNLCKNSYYKATKINGGKNEQELIFASKL